MSFGRSTAGGLAVDAGVVDDGVHATELIDLVCDRACLLLARQVADDDARGPRCEFGQDVRPLAGAGVKDHFVALLYQRLGGAATQAVGGPRDEHSTHVPSFESTLRTSHEAQRRERNAG